jgi:FdhD protein
MAEHAVTTTWRIVKYDGAEWREREDEIAAEFPLTVRLDGEEFATMVCTPCDLADLVVGFLASEGVILTPDDIVEMSIDSDRGMADVELKRKHTVGAEFYGKRFIGSCCGKSRQFYFHNDARTAKTVTSRIRVSAAQCIELMRLLQEGSDEFHNTGGVHNAALCGPQELLVARTDIGRHNALDKVFGHCLRQRIATGDKILAFSGRLSSEVVLKAAKIGAGILLSKSAPTDLALQLAEDLGITAVGFIRSGRMNVYTHAERIV